MAPSLVYLLFLKERYLNVVNDNLFASISSKLHVLESTMGVISDGLSREAEWKLHSDTRHFRGKKKDEGKPAILRPLARESLN